MGLADLRAALDAQSLRTLLLGLRSGRMRLTDSAAALRMREFPADAAALIADAFVELAREGWNEGTLAEALEALAAEAEAAARGGPQIVSTTTRNAQGIGFDTAVALRQLFAQAHHELLLAGFRVSERKLLSLLQRPEEQPLTIRLYVDVDPMFDPFGRRIPRVSGPEREIVERWKSAFLEQIWPEAMPPPELYYSPLTLEPDERGAWHSMHAKAAIVDRRKLLIGSANFTSRGLYRNLELGLALDNPRLAEQVSGHFAEMTRTGVFKRM